MKKIILFIAAIFVSFSVFSQIAQIQSDSIVLQYMSEETRQYAIFAQEGTPAKFVINTSQKEAIELDYSCRVYYVSYIEQVNANHYLIVKRSNGSVLRVNTKDDEIPNDLADWRIVKAIEIPYIEYILDSNFCQWTNLNYENDTILLINSNENLEYYITCDSFPIVDFNQYSLLLVYGSTASNITSLNQQLALLSADNYKITIKMQLQDSTEEQRWLTAIIVPKLTQNTMIALKIEYVGEKVLMLTVDYLTNTFLGGKELVFSNNSSSFTITHQYKDPCDFGFLKLFYQELDELLFYGTIVWMGLGNMVFPDNLLQPEEFDTVIANDTILPKNGMECIFNVHGAHTDSMFVWSAVQSLAKAREYLQSNPNQKINFFLYTPSVGAVDPTKAYWVLFLKK